MPLLIPPAAGPYSCSVNGATYASTGPLQAILVESSVTAKALKALGWKDVTGLAQETAPLSTILAWALVQSFQLISLRTARDANGAITQANILWPDGTPGVFTTDVASTAFPGAIDAWHVTYVAAQVTHTITQPVVTRDANGAVSAQPQLTIA